LNTDTKDHALQELPAEKTALEEQVTSLKADVHRLQLEHGILEKAGEIPQKGQGISPEVANIVSRDFYAEAPNTKWLTDINEFAIPVGKVYLSPIIDCSDGLVVAWTTGTSPSAELVNSMLGKAVSLLQEDVNIQSFIPTGVSIAVGRVGLSEWEKPGCERLYPLV
jgi:hypothetical protein